MDASAPPEDARVELYRTTLFSLLRLLLGFGLFVAAVSLLAWAFREPITGVGHWFIRRFGVVGMGAGTFLADGFHFPVPPQFYLLAGVAAGASPPVVVAGVTAGSVLGGLVAFAAGRRLSSVEVLERWSRAPRRLLQELLNRYGNWGLVIAGLLPLSYWLLCVVGGVLKLPYRAYAVLALMRVPRLLLTYALIVLAWRW